MSLIASACLLTSSGLNAGVAEDVSNFKKLDAKQKEDLVQGLSGKSLKKLKPEELLKVQKACFELSKQLIGSNGKGGLKTVKDPSAASVLKVAGDYLNNLPVEQTPAHPAAGALFGEVPAKAPRVTQSVEINPWVVRWHATGLYAAPGEVVTLKFPKEWVGKGLKVQLSGHTDKISTKKKLQRLPTSPARAFEVNATEVKISGAFGGAIYINTGNERRKDGKFQVAISNAVKAPYYVLGSTSLEKWKNELKNAPAPYAEFVTPRVALSFPSAWIRDLEDPKALLEYWDEVVKLHDELGGLGGVRYGPERVNVDVQISVGLFHAGYPTQGPQAQCRGVVDLAKLKTKGNWGWFHEMGHESQRRPDKAWGWNNPYTFDGSIEVTVNLFSSHAMDRLKMKDRGGWSWTASAYEVAKRADKVLKEGKSYPEMGAGDKLAMYLQLRDAFGWDPIGKVLASYSQDQDKRPGILPKLNQEKRDVFMVRMSRQVERNLAPFMEEVWGIKLGKDAKNLVKDLPVWIPEGFEKFTSTEN
ncbi:hypothetical protein Rhal01_00785 [Rubritalea halochordaticola]|uniref:Peptidase M60 domain-containing protein n=1 Tax=Rubritalea halochordaticola TaxID=714537 RepID=A0ABP9UW77_9BACT